MQRVSAVHVLNRDCLGNASSVLGSCSCNQQFNFLHPLKCTVTCMAPAPYSWAGNQDHASNGTTRLILHSLFFRQQATRTIINPAPHL